MGINQVQVKGRELDKEKGFREQVGTSPGAGRSVTFLRALIKLSFKKIALMLVGNGLKEK